MATQKMKNLEKEEKLEYVENNVAVLQDFQNITITPGHFADYEESVIIGEQPLNASRGSRLLPIHTLAPASGSDPFFKPASGLDFLIGVPEVLLLLATGNSKLSDSMFVVKIPKGETLYLGMENSKSMQKVLLCSQRSFNMAFLDPNKKEAVTFIRKAALMNFGSFFKQELIAFTAESNTPMGRIQQNSSFSTVAFSIMDDKNKHIYQIIGSETTMIRKLNQDVHFSILDPVDRTGGVILHKWDDEYKDFVYHITFPSSETLPQHKVLLIGMALLVEYTYFKTSGCLCFK